VPAQHRQVAIFSRILQHPDYPQDMEVQVALDDGIDIDKNSQSLVRPMLSRLRRQLPIHKSHDTL
jgi:hypothetical protein